jgi:hypothetical protein
MFNQATSTWSAQSKPKFERKTTAEGNEIRVELKTTSKPFVYVEGGTDRRFMHMQPGYKPKSVPGSLRARTGGGKTAGIDWPKPGIVARDFRKVIAEKRANILAAKIAAIVAKSVNV